MIGRYFQRSLAVRLSAAFLALSVGTVLLATYVSYRNAETALRQRLLERLEMFALDDAAQLADWQYRQRAAVQVLASLASSRAAALAPDGGPTRSRLLGRIDPALLAATHVMMLSVPGGRVIRSSDSTLLDTYAVDQLSTIRKAVSTRIRSSSIHRA